MSKRVLFHNFFPTKAQEEGGDGSSDHGGHVEIRNLPSDLYSYNITKVVQKDEIKEGVLKLNYHETLENVYISGKRGAKNSYEMISVSVWDVTEGGAVEYHSCLMKDSGNKPFRLGWDEFITARRVKRDDEIALSYDAASRSFQLQLLRRA